MMAQDRKVSVPIIVSALALFVVAGACILVAYYGVEQPGVRYKLDPGSPLRGNLLLASRLLVVLGELAVVLGLVRYFFTFFTTVSVAGVTIGSMALVIVLSIMSGFETDLQDKILGSNAHISITKEEGVFTEYREVSAKLDGVSGVVGHSPYVTSEVVIVANKAYSNVIIKGVEPDSLRRVTDLSRKIKKDPSAIEKLWPLAEDGTVIGPPRNRVGVAPPQDAGVAQPPQIDARDPAPNNMEVPRGLDPVDLSGGELPPDAGPPGPDAGAPDAAIVAAARTNDPAPADMELGDERPRDLSGTGPDSEDDGEGSARIVDITADDIEMPDFGSPVGIEPRVARLSGILVGKELVKTIHLYSGQEIRVVSPLTEDTPAGPVPRIGFYRVAGVFFTGMYEYDLKFVYVELGALQDFLDLGDQVNGVEVRISDPEDADAVRGRIQRTLGPGYRVQTWKEINRSLFSALKLEKIAMFLVLVIIILVASFSIIGNLIMVVVEKAKEIALLKTLGAQDRSVMQIFVTQGLLIGGLGTGLGVMHGLLISYLVSVLGFPLSADVYYIDRLPIHIEWIAVVLVAAAGLFISVVATIYPAWVAARLRPVEGMRYE